MGLDDYDAWLRAHEATAPKQSAFDREPRPVEQRTRRVFAKLVRRVARMIEGDARYNFCFFDRTRRALVGSAVVQVLARHHDQLAWLGYSVFNHEWRKGYGREGVGAVLRLAFHELGLHRVEARIQPQNRPSVKLARSLGMVKAYRSSVLVRKEWAPVDVYAAHAEEWGVRDTRPTVGLEQTWGRVALTFREASFGRRLGTATGRRSRGG